MIFAIDVDVGGWVCGVRLSSLPLVYSSDDCAAGVVAG